MTKDIKLSLAQGTAIIRVAQIVNMPEKIGERTFKGTIRGSINRKIRALYKLLKKLSPILQEDDLTYFGPRDSWKRKERTAGERDKLGKNQGGAEVVDKVSYTAKDRKETVDVHLTGTARDGLTWVLFLWCHPESDMCMGAGAQERMVWDIAQQLAAVKFLEKETGLDDKEAIEIEYDDAEPEEKPKDQGESDTEEPPKKGIKQHQETEV